MAFGKRTSGGFFSMHRNERKASLQLAGLCFLVMIALGLRAYFHQPAKVDPKVIAHFQQRVDAWKLKQEQAAHRSNAPKKDPIPAFSRYPQIVPFFDPNELDDAGWLHMGLSKKQLKTLRNYQAKGGFFESVDDLQRVYSLGDDFVERYGKFARFPSGEKASNDLPVKEEKSAKAAQKKPLDRPLEKIKIDINTADSADLVALRGVGPFYARQILRTRTALGGFVKLEQLNEVWKMRKETYGSLLEQVEVLSPPICLEVNLAKAEELAKHPYVNWNLARSIANYRELNGPYLNADQLKKLHLMEDSVWIRLLPYLCLDDNN